MAKPDETNISFWDYTTNQKTNARTDYIDLESLNLTLHVFNTKQGKRAQIECGQGIELDIRHFNGAAISLLVQKT